MFSRPSHQCRIRSWVLLAAMLLCAWPLAAQTTYPEPAGWYAGDMHVHRSCGNSPFSVSSVYNAMGQQSLSALSLLADMGNAEVQDAATDLPLVNGQDASISTLGRILHWDAEWHWDATYYQYAHQALGGHVVALGLTEAHQIWEEYTYPIFNWAHQQNGIAGFAHFQYLDDNFPTTLTCCTPVEYPVEVSLGASDFISEDVNGSDYAIHAYYRLLNSGFRPGFAAGTDYPCNDGVTVGAPLTYVRVPAALNYRDWIDGISNGKTVVSRGGHNEFLDLKVNGTAGPGDEIHLTGGGTVQASAQWTANQNLSGTIELVANGAVVASKQTSVTSSTSSTLSTSVAFGKSGWLVARRMGSSGHVLHTAAVFVTVDNAPVRANATDPQFYVQWMNNLLANTSPGGQWNWYFPTSLSAAQARYQASKSLFQQIANEAQGTAPALSSITVTPANGAFALGSTQQFIATGNYADGHSVNITAQVAWTSSNATVAKINLRGLALGLTSGTTTISASLGNITGTTSATLQVPPVVITTQSLPAGTAGASYSATVAASGGMPPYTWSIAAGSLPSGLSLASGTGIISGTPAAAGTFSFTVQATDANAPAQTATMPLSIVIGSTTSCPCTIWPATAAPAIADSGPDSAVELGVKFRADVDGYITGIRFYKGVGNTGTHVGNLWTSSGTRLANATFSGETASGWQQVNFSPQVAIRAGTVYVASYHTNVGHYADDQNYFASNGQDAPPLHALQDGVSGFNGVFAYGASSAFPNGGWNSSNYWVDVVFTPAVTATLNSIAVTPANPTIVAGNTQQFLATGTYSDLSTKDITNQVTWASSQTSVATITSAGLATALAPGSSVISATQGAITGITSLSVQAGPLTITTASLPGAVQNQTYSAALSATGGVLPYSWALATGSSLPVGLSLSTAGQISGIPALAGTSTFTVQLTDSGSPPQQSGKQLSITITAPPSFYTIWNSGTTPGTLDSGPDSSVELGVKFKADINGSITGIRFYKSTLNTGTHVGNLWTNTGTLLASATFNSETVSGWQQVNFATPVAITAGTVYVASYHTTVGHYSDDLNYFAGKGVDNPPLHALQDGVSGFDGVFAYGSGNLFPAQGWNSSNYWVDVVFVPAGPDTTPPTVVSVNPANGASGVPTNTTTVTAAFSEALDATTVNSTTVRLLDASNTVIPATVRYATGTYTVTLTPTSILLNSTTYTAVIMGGTTDPRVKDLAGNALAANYSWSFTTAAPPPPPPNEGPGGPILIVSSSANPFSRYYTEILRNEGLNEFTAMDMSLVSSTTLSGYDVVILGDMPLSSAQVTMLSDWVTAGGNLIAMHPDKQLAGLLGLSATSNTLADSYLALNTVSGPGAGLVDQSIQYHGSADLYALNGATSLAALYSSATAPTSNPAVTLRAVGSGQAAAFTYDLARSVVYTRQGNPAWSGEERDGFSPIRSDDLYFGAATFDPQRDWVDLNKVAIPQADEQQRLLANLILQMNAARRPLPRFWYLPRGLKAVVVMTGDDHGVMYSGGATASRFNQYLADSPAGCSVADWQCVRASSYLFPPSIASNPLTNTQAASYIAQGFEIGVHVDSAPSTCSDWTTAELDSDYTNEIASFRSKYTSVPAPKTHRMHCISWSDFDSQPQVELSHGIRLDTTYYYWPGSWIGDRPGLFTGSGMPMRFAKRDGTILDIYQAATQMTDESDQSYPFTIDTLLDNALGATGYYGAFTTNMHNDVASSPEGDAIVASARARGVPIVSAAQMLTWLDGRNGSSFASLSRAGDILSFTIQVGTGANGLQALLPVNSGSARLSSITLNGTAVAYTTQTIKGVLYAVFPATAGAYQTNYSGTSTVAVTSVALSPPSVTGGSSSTGTVILSGPAPASGVSIALASGDPATATVPSTVAVAAGATSATFQVTTNTVAAVTTVTVSASYAGSSASAGLTVNPLVALSSLALNPTSVTGGSASTGTVTLNFAPSVNVTVSLQSSNTALATVPATVTVPAGSTSADFTATTFGVSSTSTVTISATYNGTTQTAVLTVLPPAVTGLSLSPTTLLGGNTSTGTVTLAQAAPAGGVVVALSSANTGVATVPASVTVPAGSSTASFTVNTLPVTASTQVAIIASLTGNTRSATLTVTPPSLSTLALSPTSVAGGNSPTGTVTLTGNAPAGGVVVSLSSSNTSAATVPPSVTVAAGARTATFTITTKAVTTSTTSTISASYSGVTRTATLTVTRAALTSLALSPTTVVGGNPSSGTVTLTGTAPSGGIVVTLRSSNTTYATVPSSVTVPAGSRTATFTVTTRTTTRNRSITISGTYSGVSRSATLTVTP